MIKAYVIQNDRLTDLFGPLESRPLETPAWIDVFNPTPEEDKEIEHLLGIEIPSREDMEEIELSARLYNEDGAEFMTMSALAQMDINDPIKTPITYILKGQTLVTVRYADCRPFTSFIVRAQRKNGLPPGASAETIMLGLIEAFIDRIADTLELLGNEVDALSRDIFRAKASKVNKKTGDLQMTIAQIGSKGDILTMVRESLVSLARLLTHHMAGGENADQKTGKSARQKVSSLQRDTTALADHAAFLSNKINFLLDATLGLISLEQNQIIKIFSVASVVFLPPTLVASIYGMNFKHMPELDWGMGYPLALVFMIISAVLPFLYFKKKGWL